MNSTRPLRVCFLWHQHQPDYRVDGEFFLPWVRLHAVKDYVDLTEILSRYPVKHTINVVPSLLRQLDAYADGITDELERLSRMKPERLTYTEKKSLAAWATTIQRATMVSPLPRYSELFDVLSENRFDNCSTEDWQDVQVLVNLAWLGPIGRQNPVARALMEKGRMFTREDVDALLTFHHDRMKSVVPTLHRSELAGRIEVSVTPFNHPILPLLITTNAAAECMPKARLPQPPYEAPGNAWRSVRSARNEWHTRTGVMPVGMWPAEGSISQQALELLSSCGVQWTASDEAVLRNSLGGDQSATDAYYPYEVETPSGPITILFRDHALSDAIGFSYASWNAADAANDFVRRLEERRALIVATDGEEALATAVIPIMLDGENCWEFYENNGADFLHELLSRLSDARRYTSLTCSEATTSAGKRRLHRIRAGSWINADFSVWIGSAPKNMAWTLLREAKRALEEHGYTDHEVAEELAVVEASDWFWWYDDRHQAPHKPLFDVIFRKHMAAIFEKCSVEPPIDLSRPLAEVHMDGEKTHVPIIYGTTAMHRSNALARDVAIASHDEWNRLSLRLERRPNDTEEIVVQIFGQDGLERACLITNEDVLWRSAHHDEGFEWLGEHTLAFYLHAHNTWTLKVTEERSGQASLSTMLSIASAR